MCCCQIDTLLQAFGAHNSKHDGFAAIIKVNLVTCFQLHAGFIFFKTFSFCQLNAVINAETLCLAMVQEILVTFAVSIHLFLFCSA